MQTFFSAEQFVTLTDAEHLVHQLRLGIEAHALVTIADVDGIISFANDKLCQATGFSQDEIIGNTHALFKSGFHEPAFFADMYDTIGSGQVFQGLFCNRNRNGDLIWLDTTITPILTASGKPSQYVSIRRDVTELIHAQERQQKMLDELNQALAARDILQAQLLQATKLETIGQLTAGIAHDFNNILTVVLGYAQLAQDSVENGSAAEIADYLHYVETAGNRGKDLVTKLMQYCRRNQTAKKVLAPIDPAPVISQALDMLRPTFSSTIQLCSHIDNAVAQHYPRIVVDPSELTQLCVNLLVNAKDAINVHGTISVSLKTESYGPLQLCSDCGQALATEHAQNYVEIKVADSGCGMDEMTLNRIFDPFFTTKAVGQGTGLGLSVISGIVHEAGGHIVVASTPGHGTVFSLLFPPAVSALADSASQTAEDAAPPFIPRKVLVIDDEPMVAGLIQAQLTKAGHEPQVFVDAHAGLAAFKANRNGFDVLLVDYQMPQLDGLSLAAEVRALHPTLPMGIYSGSHIAPELLPARCRKFDKPMAIKPLLQWLAQLDD